MSNQYQWYLGPRSVILSILHQLMREFSPRFTYSTYWKRIIPSGIIATIMESQLYVDKRFASLTVQTFEVLVPLLDHVPENVIRMLEEALCHSWCPLSLSRRAKPFYIGLSNQMDHRWEPNDKILPVVSWTKKYQFSNLTLACVGMLP